MLFTSEALAHEVDSFHSVAGTNHWQAKCNFFGTTGDNAKVGSNWASAGAATGKFGAANRGASIQFVNKLLMMRTQHRRICLATRHV